MATPTLNEVIGAYRQLRAKKDELAKRHKEEMAPINNQLNVCLAWVHNHLNEQGTRNARTDSGSVFLQTDVSVTVEDWNAILDYIKQHQLWDFLERRVSKSVITEFMESNRVVPPGVKVSSEVSCHIRA